MNTTAMTPNPGMREGFKDSRRHHDHVQAQVDGDQDHGHTLKYFLAVVDHDGRGLVERSEFSARLLRKIGQDIGASLL
jgi:hypothetical protein